MDSGGGSFPATAEAIRRFFETGGKGEPYTSTEVATELDCARTTAYKNLQRLVDGDVLRTKKVGARGRVWWLPVGADDRVPSDASSEDEPRSPATGPGSTAGGPGSTAGGPDSSDPLDRSADDLAGSERTFRAVFEKAFDAILIAADDGRYVDVNPAACDLFGLPREELIGRTGEEFAAEGYRHGDAWADFREADLTRGLFPLVRADGERRTVEFAATPNILPGYHLSVIRDVTERRETRSELERERERSRRYMETLVADAVIELEIAVDGDDLFTDLSDRLDCTCTFEGVVPTVDGRLLQYVTVAGASTGSVTSAVTASPLVNDCRLVYRSDATALLELDADRSPVRTLAEAGAGVRRMWNDGDGTKVVAEVGADADLQALTNAFTAAFPSARVVAKRTLDRPIVTRRQYRDSLVGTLTDRQTEAFRAAYLAGYFEWPRNSQAEDIAASMGIAVSTWLRHLRLAEAKLARWLFEELEA